MESMCACGHAKLLQLCLTLCDPMTIAHQAPLSRGFSRQEYWSGLPFLPPGGLPNPRIEPMSLVFPALAGEFFTTQACRKPMESIVSPLKSQGVWDAES